MTIRVGEVIAVNGTKITLKIDEDSNKDTLFFKGDKYRGVSIREYLTIQRGFRDIVCLVEGEYLDETHIQNNGGKIGYIRKVEARPIGYFDLEGFKQGIKYMPMIKDSAFLLSEDRVAKIYDRDAGGKGDTGGFKIGVMLKEELPVGLPWQSLFNSHIGIFGNTGSGKSNTLAKLYTVLFEKKLASIQGKSHFVILDFNGEYVGEQLAPAASKHVYALTTQNSDPNAQVDRFPLLENEFWDLETLSLLFQATTNTQRPFLNRVIEGKKRYGNSADALSNYAKRKFRDVFSAADSKPATLDLIRAVARLVGNDQLLLELNQVSWHSTNKKFYSPGGVYYNPDGQAYEHHLEPTVDTINATGLDAFSQLILRIHLQLIGDLINGYVQFEHIQPLLKRIESSLSSLKKVLSVGSASPDQKLLTVISLRRCNNEIKKVLPLLFAKHYYNTHKDTVQTPPNKTVHLIIDEAHNILSHQSARESESWKDYRLEQFEEIIKEGRKFGIFITVASQRPADISPTIVSQLHNFFIHRLVNDRDLFLIDNTITTLDNLSRSLIPSLSQGCCVVTGTAFDLPMVLQIDRLAKNKQPASEDVDLEDLWREA